MRVRWFLSLASVVLLVVGLTVVLYDRFGDDKGSSTTSTSDTTPDDTGDTGGDLTGPGLVTVEGTVAEVHLVGAVLDPQLVQTPLTLTASRGEGNGAELTNVDVAGKPSVIVWDGGRPFVLASGPGVLLDPLVADLGADGMHLTLGDGAHTLQPGSFQLNTPVAVGGASTTPAERDSVAFVAEPHALLEAKGDTALVLGPARGPVHLNGPGAVHLAGALTVRHGKDHRSAKSLDLRASPFELAFTPLPGGGWKVTGRLQSSAASPLTLDAGQ